MDNQEKRIRVLHTRLENLIRTQESMAGEIQSLRSEIDSLKSGQSIPGIEKQKVLQEDPSEKKIISGWRLNLPPQVSENIEGFIGGNLINKIGIIILILGVGIGIKFAIDRDLISPVIRLMLGYLIGIMLMVLAFRTRKNYLNFSAVLASGSVATVYFLTYAGHAYYSLIPTFAAYGLMIAITGFAIYLSLNYDKEVISIIGLVGAYAIPFLLGQTTENHLILFMYISLINLGILIVSIRKFWRWLYYGAFTLTWLIYISWLKEGYFAANDFSTALVFGFIFFCLFYLTFINHKFVYGKKFQAEDIFLLVANSFIFYGLGYYVLSGYEPAAKYSGLFTIGNAAIHLAVTGVLYKRHHPDRSLRQFVIGLALVFLTIAIPVEFEANWVTLFWFLEALVLLYTGRTGKIPFYEYFAYAILMLGFYSLIDDWIYAYSAYQAGEPELQLVPLLNVFFLGGLIALISTAMMNYIHFRNIADFPLQDPTLKNIINYGMAGILIIICYFVFRNEIAIYWKQLYIDSEKEVPVAMDSSSTYLLRDPNLRLLGISWILIYTTLFAGALTILNVSILKIKALVLPVILINMVVILIFLLQGLYIMGELRENYLNPNFLWDFNPGKWNIGIRYAGIIAAAGLILLNEWYSRKNIDEQRMRRNAGLFTFFAILWILTSELVHWQHMAGVGGSYKIGISILWGVYSLMMVIIGIWRRKKYLRFGAILLFAITLVKLFFYDLSDLNTIAKTIVFISLGILLLIISFLYNKYNRVLLD
jgi:uncharacterized membrane protein